MRLIERIGFTSLGGGTHRAGRPLLETGGNRSDILVLENRDNDTPKASAPAWPLVFARRDEAWR